jgi:large subunit ribosomal protein L25
MELKAEIRKILGKQVKQLRRDGFTPAEVYGHGKENMHITVPTKEFKKLYKKAGESSVITLSVDGKNMQVFIASVDKDHVKDEINSVDFHEVKKGEHIHVNVAVKFVGNSPAAKAGKTIVQSLDEVEIEAAIDALPHELSIDISTLEKEGDTIHVTSIELPKGVKMITNKELVIESVAEQTKEEAVAPVAEETPAVEKK